MFKKANFGICQKTFFEEINHKFQYILTKIITTIIKDYSDDIFITLYFL